MLNAIKKYHGIISKWNVDIYERENTIFRFKARIYFQDKSLLRIKEYHFSDGARKYAYHWESHKGDLIIRWDNSPHWHHIPTYPHHKHIKSAKSVEPSDETHLDAVLELIASTIKKQKSKKRK